MEQEQQRTPFRINDIKDLVPEKLKPWILVLFVLIYQVSGGIYMAAVSEMSSALALMNEDVMMAGYASMVGLALTFTVMFRLKFRFTIRTSLIVTAVAMMLCNLITMTTDSVPLLVAVSFVSGFFRMWGTFACNTTIQLWITPKRDMAEWFVFIYFLVQGAIQLSGLCTIYASLLGTWEQMHWIMAGLLAITAFVTIVLFRDHRPGKVVPLDDIDWTGAALWAVTVLSLIFVLNYGNHYDWFDSERIWAGALVFAVCLGVNLWRSTFIEQPFIALETWRFRNVWLTALLYPVVDTLLSPSHAFEHLYMASVLNYDALHAVSMNWFVWGGIVCGAGFSWVTFAKRRWRFKTMTFIGFALVMGYLISMYFLIDYHQTKAVIGLALFLRGAGFVMIAISFITSLTILPFPNFAQALTVQGFFSACIGSLLGTTILKELLLRCHRQNFVELSGHFNGFWADLRLLPVDVAYGTAQRHALLESMKEIYGYLVILGLFCILAFFMRESSLGPKRLIRKAAGKG